MTLVKENTQLYTGLFYDGYYYDFNQLKLLKVFINGKKENINTFQHLFDVFMLYQVNKKYLLDVNHYNDNNVIINKIIEVYKKTEEPKIDIIIRKNNKNTRISLHRISLFYNI